MTIGFGVAGASVAAVSSSAAGVAPVSVALVVGSVFVSSSFVSGACVAGVVGAASVVGALVVGSGVPHWARQSAVGAEPRISVMGSHCEAMRSSAMEVGFGAPRVSQTLSPTVSRSPAPYLALQTMESPSQVHWA